MPDPIAIAIGRKLVPAGMKALLKLALPDEIKWSEGPADSAIDTLWERFTDAGKAREGEDAFRDIADKVCADLAVMLQSDPHVQGAEAAEVAQALADCILKVDPVDVLAGEVRYDSEAYESRLRAARPDAVKWFTDAQRSLYDKAVHEAAGRIVKVGKKLRGFTEGRVREALENTIALKQLAEQALTGIDRLQTSVDSLGTAVNRIDARTERTAGDVRKVAAHHSDLDEDRRTYLQFMAERTRVVPLRGLATAAADAQSRDEPPGLAEIYITLETIAPRTEKRPEAHVDREEVQRIPVLRAFASQSRIALIGDPGSGKSTFVNHLIYCLSQGQIERDFVWPDEVPEEFRGLLPVLVTLREMAAWQREKEIQGEKVGLLKSYLTKWLTDNIGLGDFAPVVMQAMKDGKALLLLDGWDEVPSGGEAHEPVRAMLEALPRTLKWSRLLVTCRTRSYADPSWQLNGREWPAVSILEFNGEQIDRFIVAWYAQLSRRGAVKDGPAMAGKLQTAVRRSDLRRMAGNPMLLTIMAIDHADRGELPDARSVVYEDVTDLLLWRWRQSKDEEDVSHSLLDLLRASGRQEIDLKRLLWQLAFEAQEAGVALDAPEASADIGEHALLKAFATLTNPPSLDCATEFLRLMQLRAGLLVPSSPGCFAFPHRTFQEYLAACHVTRPPDVVNRLYDLACRGVYWREVVLLAVNRLVYKDADSYQPGSLAKRLCPLNGNPDNSDDDAWRRVVLAGECILEIGLHRLTEDDSPFLERLRSRLTHLVSHGLLSVPERARAGQILSILGDPRDLREWIPIPAGEFLMGDEDLMDTPRRAVRLSGYSIRKYPVTEGEYAEFTADTGFAAPSHWIGGTPPAERRNCPVVNVSWHDAVAFCNWLSAREGRSVRLPTEAQWERAARGEDGRQFPWGNEWDPARCANGLAGFVLHESMAVGGFPTGESPCGAQDMAGNVWAYCLDAYGPELRNDATEAGKEPANTSADASVRHAMRGGCWATNAAPWYFRSAHRGYSFPSSRDNYVGFRCVRFEDSR
jgi:formylglycine-generating enzyme required for sulfatase activity